MASDETMEEPQREDEAADAGGGGVRGLGPERWVQFGFIAFAALLFWLLDKIVTSVWGVIALQTTAIPEPEATTSAGIGALLAMITTAVLYRNEGAKAFADEAVNELIKVTWPNRKETWANTVVVVITSIIAAIILFALDATWSAITDLIYKV